MLLDHCPLSLGHRIAFAGHNHFTIDPDLLCNPVSPGPWHCCLALWPLLLDTTNYFPAMSTPAADFATFGVSSSIQGQSLVEIPLHCIGSYLLNGEPKQRRFYPSAFKSNGRAPLLLALSRNATHRNTADTSLLSRDQHSFWNSMIF